MAQRSSPKSFATSGNPMSALSPISVSIPSPSKLVVFCSGLLEMESNHALDLRRQQVNLQVAAQSTEETTVSNLRVLIARTHETGELTLKGAEL